MVRVAPIKLQYNPKILWFDPQDLEIKKNDAVVVTTARGIEFGHAYDDIIEVDEAELQKMKIELKEVLRLATEEDEEKAREMQQRSNEAMPIFKEMAAELVEEMHPVSVEFLLDGDKAVFYFASEERVDFRDLVRKLASKFHVRIDMRQIGVRDEARAIGGLGHCGQELCCKRLGGEFSPVSIRMAKEQDLSLNPQKISGVCGRLMCCLRYEFEAYKDFKERAPKINAMIETPEGPAKVVELNVPREIVTIQLEGEKRVKIPLSEMTKANKDERPSKVSKKVYEAYANQSLFHELDSLISSQFSSSSIFSSSDTSSQQGKKSSRSSDAKTSEPTRKPRRRTKVDKEGQSKTEQVSEGEKKDNRKQSGQNRKRKDSSRNRQDSKQNQNKAKQNKQKKRSSQKSAKTEERSKQTKNNPRPGQGSSGLRKSNQASTANNDKGGGTSAAPVRRRRRRTRVDGDSGKGSSNGD